MKNHKEALLDTAIELLKGINPYHPETVDVDSTVYDDGSASLTITVNYPEHNEDNVPKEVSAE